MNNNKMKVLELFGGSRSFSKVAEEFGHKTYSKDYKRFQGIDQVCDIRNFNVEKMFAKFGSPEIIWASPPCTYFSVASIGHHWNKDNTPKTENAKLGIEIVKHTLWLIKLLEPKYFYIENPRGKLRKLDVITNENFIRNTITYCSYNENRMKPTDIWTNDYNWIPRKMCFNGNRDCHHQPAPRGSQTGTQGLKGNYERSKVPSELCREILKGINQKESK